MTRVLQESLSKAILRKTDGKNQYHLTLEISRLLRVSVNAEKAAGEIWEAIACCRAFLERWVP